jgi:hypothetical protein
VQNAISARTNPFSQNKIAVYRAATRSEPACSRHPLTVRTMRSGLWLLAIGLALTTSCNKPAPEVKPLDQIEATAWEAELRQAIGPGAAVEHWKRAAAGGDAERIIRHSDAMT